MLLCSGWDHVVVNREDGSGIVGVDIECDIFYKHISQFLPEKHIELSLVHES